MLKRSTPFQPNFPQSMAALGVSLALAFAVASIGGWVTAGSVSTWYAALAKPAFNPPNWVFAPAWAAFYILMAVAAWRAWFALATLRHRAFAIYGAQLALNLLWPVLFFGAHLIGAALLDSGVLLAAIVATGIAFWRIDRFAGLCLVPYAAWVAFATLLNAAIWRLN